MIVVKNIEYEINPLKTETGYLMKNNKRIYHVFKAIIECSASYPFFEAIKIWNKKEALELIGHLADGVYETQIGSYLCNKMNVSCIGKLGAIFMIDDTNCIKETDINGIVYLGNFFKYCLLFDVKLKITAVRSCFVEFMEALLMSTNDVMSERELELCIKDRIILMLCKDKDLKQYQKAMCKMMEYFIKLFLKSVHQNWLDNIFMCQWKLHLSSNVVRKECEMFKKYVEILLSPTVNIEKVEYVKEYYEKFFWELV